MSSELSSLSYRIDSSSLVPFCFQYKECINWLKFSHPSSIHINHCLTYTTKTSFDDSALWPSKKSAHFWCSWLIAAAPTLATSQSGNITDLILKMNFYTLIFFAASDINTETRNLLKRWNCSPETKFCSLGAASRLYGWKW